MTREEAIKTLGYGAWWDSLPSDISDADMNPLQDAIDIAINAIREQIKRDENEPLTLDELREMDGDPVWIVFTPDGDEDCLSLWALVSVENDSGEIFLVNNIVGSSYYEEVSDDIKAIYRRKPEEETL